MSLITEIPSLLLDLTTESVLHPLAMLREYQRFLANCCGVREKPAPGLVFEQHAHSHFSNWIENFKVVELSDVVNHLLGKGVSILSLTDHGNSNAFDQLRAGKYKLNRSEREEYELEFSPDGRSMIIHSSGKQLVLLRSIEYWTDKGEIGIHGYSGRFPDPAGSKMPLTDAIKKGIDGGGYVVIHHPYFFMGIGHHGGKKTIEMAVRAGVIAIEKNGMEIPPQIYSPIRAERHAQEFDLALVASSDAHILQTYARSGQTFNPEDYQQAYESSGENHADVVHKLIREKRFKTHFSYCTPREVLVNFLGEELRNRLLGI